MKRGERANSEDNGQHEEKQRPVDVGMFGNILEAQAIIGESLPEDDDNKERRDDEVSEHTPPRPNRGVGTTEGLDRRGW